MTPLSGALHYARSGWRVLPVRQKRPLIRDWQNIATWEQETIVGWWMRWPDAQIGALTGRLFVVLDIDVKDPRANGFDSLEQLGAAVLPVTPMARTPSGGTHLYFQAPQFTEIRNTAGVQGAGIGPGLDWRGVGGFIACPTPGAGAYAWEPGHSPDDVAFAPVPPALFPRKPAPPVFERPVRPCDGRLTPYGDAACNNAYRRIAGAFYGRQEATLNREAYALGRLAGADAVPADYALAVLREAAGELHVFDPRRPWKHRDLINKVDRSFRQGIARPRPVITRGRG